MTDFSKTINLPITAFAMKANLSETENLRTDFWREKKILLVSTMCSSNSFISERSGKHGCCLSTSREVELRPTPDAILN